MSKPKIISTGAVFSECRKYRYLLWRVWNNDKKFCMFVGLNPSTADETNDDPTIRRCIDYCYRWGYGGYFMTNIFAFRSTDPKKMKLEKEPIGPQNDNCILDYTKQCELIVAAWGKDGNFMNRGEEVLKMLPKVHCLKLNNDGTPAHPLYLKKDLIPFKL